MVRKRGVRTLFLLLMVVAVGYWVLVPTRLDVLTEAQAPYVKGLHSGVIDIVPGQYAVKDIRDFSEYGLITVVEFHDDACLPCGMMRGKLQQLSELRPDISIKLIHVDKNQVGFWGEQYGLTVQTIPYIILLDKEGRIIAAGGGDGNDGFYLIDEWLSAELKRQSEQT